MSIENRILYVVQARYVHEVNGWETSDGLPTFYLDADVQGIRTVEHAAQIARKIIDPLNLYGAIHVVAARTSYDDTVTDQTNER